MTTTTAFEGEEILNDRLRMEDEWMSTQGPYSEFRMNLNTSNPLLLAVIAGAGGGGGTNTTGSGPFGGTHAGLFLRSRNAIPGGNDDDDDADGGDAFGGAFGRGGGYHHPYMGPLAPAGTDKDFVWGFILGFFVGYIMLFWIWMPTVPHKQKIGIISGISFQLVLNLLRKSGQADVVM
ncbi:hypothetical protein ACHAW5_010184 [Stephanodiscus triporus]|uniref:DSC E3 ubiquitin ligase complex subunit 3 C-terminal domain-containing protein n=1 Tax=Stephanodiscus triporus TaxID=2934178 RepID=A0ABD3PP81_9STRA